MPALFLDCTDEMTPLWQRILTPGDPAIAVNIAPAQPEDTFALLQGYDTCIVDHTYFNAALLARCTGLKHIVFLGTGAGSFIDLAAAEQHGITVHTIKGYGDTTVAEHTITLALSAARGVVQMDKEVRAGAWRQVEGLQLLGKTLGIIGLGGIGKEVARLGAGLGMRVLAWNRSPQESAVATVAELDEVLATADILCLCMSLNDETRGFMDHAKLSRTKPGVIFVNTARADIVVADALVALLQSGHIRHAAIDVFSQEPPRPDDPLLTLPNVTLTAHAGFMTPEATMTMLRRAVDIVASRS